MRRVKSAPSNLASMTNNNKKPTISLLTKNKETYATTRLKNNYIPNTLLKFQKWA